MQLRRGGIFFSNHFITNFSHNVPVKKKSGKSVNILAKLWTKVCGLLFGHRVCQPMISVMCLSVAGVQGQQSTVIVTAPTYVSGTVGEAPVQTTCTNCQRSVLTSVSYETGGLTWLIFAILCFVGSVNMSACTLSNFNVYARQEATQPLPN